MSPFVSGVLGALTVLAAAALIRRAAWRRFAHSRFGARRLLRRVGATPDQEQAILAETDALAALASALRGDAAGLREDLAALLAEPAVDPARVAAALDARLARAGALKARAAEAVARIHGILGPEQRARVAELVRAGSHRSCGRRHAAHA